MSLEFEIPLVSFLFILILCFVYFSKPRIQLEENKFFEILLISGLVTSFINTMIHLLFTLISFDILTTQYLTIIKIINNVAFACVILFAFSLLFYILVISYDFIRNKAKIISRNLILITLLNYFSMFFLEFNFIQLKSTTSGDGMLVYFTYGVVFFVFLLSVIVTIINIRKKQDKRYYSMFFIIMIALLLVGFVMFFPEFNIYDLIISLSIYIMYFLLENPDLKAIDELNINRRLKEKAEESRENTFFKLAIDLENISDRIKESIKDNNIDKVNEEIRKLNYITSISLNPVSSNIKLIEKEYDFLRLINNIQKIVPEKFYLNITDSVHKDLIGDEIRVKQLIISLLKEKHLSKGFKSLNINALQKGKYLRLLLTFESSKGSIPLDVINDAYDIKDKVNSFEDHNLTLSEITLLVKEMGGNILISNKLEGGVLIRVTLDQNVKNEEFFLESPDKSVAIVSSDKKIISKLDECFTSKGYVTRVYYNYQDLVNRILRGEQFETILIDDYLISIRGVEAYKLLKEINLFDTKYIMMLDVYLENVAKNLKDMGFTKVVDKKDKDLLLKI